MFCPCILADSPETEQAMCNGVSVRQEKQEAATASPQEHGRSLSGPGTATDSL